MKVAFITHDVGIYGAARSLSLALRTVAGDGLAPVQDLWLFYHGKGPVRQVKPSTFFDFIPHKVRCYLPASKLYFGSGAKPVSFSAFVVWARFFFSAFDWYFFTRKIIKRENFAAVHLNSHTLWPLLLFFGHKRPKLVVHVRDIFDFDQAPRLSTLVVKLIIKRADQIIAIDNLAAQPFVTHKNLHILTNPVDMTSVYPLRDNKKQLLAAFKLPENRFYVALVGKVSPLKGGEHFYRLAKLLIHQPNIHLLLVGANDSPYAATVVEQIGTCANASYLGEITEIDKIYAIADVIIRCDAFLPLGRTVWEGYYAGCRILLPVRSGDDVTEIAALLDKSIWTYTAGNFVQMAEILGQMAEQSYVPPRVQGNHHDYAREFWHCLAS